MIIDVKNAIDKLLFSSGYIQINDFDKIIVQDLLSFIKEISIENSEKRIKLFKEFFLKKEDEDIEPISIEEIPSSFKILCDYDNNEAKNNKLLLSSLFTSAILEIGKYYSLNNHDKKDINKDAFKEYLSKLNEYQSKSISPDSKKENKGGAVTLEQSKQAEKEDKVDDNNTDTVKEESLEELMEQLNSLIGLDSVKKEIKTQMNLIEYNNECQNLGLKTKNLSKHMVFLGNPGTGKTTVARLVAKLYKQLGVLEKGQLVEIDRGGLVAGYVGQTAIKTKEKIGEAMGGVLFIDEAYTLAKAGNDFGQEAIDTLLKELEDNRDNFAVIVAGYPEPMETFINSNPGLTSRFKKKIVFDDYNDKELYEIFISLCKSSQRNLSEEADSALKKYLEHLCNNKPDNFANAREMRNLFETAYENVANRVLSLPKEQRTEKVLKEIKLEDLQLDKID